MAIISEVPKITPIIDRRNSQGGYYIAECDICGRTYYPARKSSKYCSSQCAMKAYRKRKENGEVKERKEFEGTRLEVQEYLKDKYNTLKKISKQMTLMSNGTWFSDYDFEGVDDLQFDIYKTNQRTYHVI